MYHARHLKNDENLSSKIFCHSYAEMMAMYIKVWGAMHGNYASFRFVWKTAKFSFCVPFFG